MVFGHRFIYTEIWTDGHEKKTVALKEARHSSRWFFIRGSTEQFMTLRWRQTLWQRHPHQGVAAGWRCSSVCLSIRPVRCWHRFNSPVRRGIFLPESTFSADSLVCVHTSLRIIARINICVHIKDPVVHVRVRRIIETLKHPACTVGWVARLCCSWLSPGKAT